MTSIGLDNGLAPNRRQGIIWTNADLMGGMSELNRRWSYGMDE